MNQLRFGILGLLASASGCVVGSAPPAAPMQPPPPPPSAYAHPGYVFYAPGQPPPRVAPAMPMPAAASIADPMNVAHLRAAAAQPLRCNLPREVAPGVFVHFDCFPYKRVAIAQKHATVQKLNFMRLGRLKWNPLAPTASPVHGVAPTGGVGAGASAGAAPQSYPDLVDHRLNGMEGPIKNQGAVGACTAFALSSVIDNSFRRGGQNVTSSPEHVWSHYGIPTMEDAASSNLNRALTTNDALPYSGREACEIMTDTSDDCGESYNVRPNTARSDASLQQRLRAADSFNGHRATAFEELDTPVNIDELVATLASGADLWVAFNLDSNVWTNNRMSNFVIPDWTNPDGGHAVALAGYRKVNGAYQFLVHNSWGTSWGDSGYAWVSQAMVQKWLHLAYKVKTDVDPTPVQPKTDEDCPGDQVMDSVTNRCAGVCPDHSRPANGQCPSGPAPGPQPLNLPGFPVIPGLPGLSGIPWIPGWQPQPQPGPQPGPQPQPQPQPSQQPVWPWPVPTNLPPFWQLPK